MMIPWESGEKTKKTKKIDKKSKKIKKNRKKSKKNEKKRKKTKIFQKFIFLVLTQNAFGYIITITVKQYGTEKKRNERCGRLGTVV